MWKNIDYQPDFYMSESLRKPHGIHDNASFKGFDPSQPRPARKPAHGHGR
jgi:hypothetical protein